MTKLVQDYRVFEGAYNRQMPLLVEFGFQPLTAKDVMEHRIEAIQSNVKDEIDFWLEKYWDTVTGLAHFNGQLIVDPNSELLLGINPESRLVRGSLPLTQEQYARLSREHEVIERAKVISDRRLTKEQAKEHPIWLELAQGDKALLREYADLVFAKAKEVYGHDENMGTFLPDDQENPALRSWYLRDLDIRSNANARNDLDGNTRLFGVRAQNFGLTLERIAKKVGITDPDEVRKGLEFYIKARELLTK